MRRRKVFDASLSSTILTIHFAGLIQVFTNCISHKYLYNAVLDYLYSCNTINDIDFEKFKSVYPQYDDNNIKLLKDNLSL